jgi:hypothetical protein
MTNLTPFAPTPAPAPPQTPLGTSEAPTPRKKRWWQRTRYTRKTPDRPCLNCGDETVGMFCPRCGQRKVDVRVSLRRMLMEVMEDQLSVNSTLPRTLAALFFRPGHLTREYVQGRIVRYIPPFRLYLVSSLIFFVILPFIADPDQIQADVEKGMRADSVRRASPAAVAARDSAVRVARAAASTPGRRTAAREDEADDDDSISMNVGIRDTMKVPAPFRPLNRRLLRGQDRLNSMPKPEAVRTLVAAGEENAPTGVFVMMPLFAFILKLLYARRKRFYVEHFVFALHVHSFAFLMFTLMMVLRVGWLNAVMATWFVLALFLAMKRVYGQGWFRTVTKFIVLSWAYLFVLMVGMIATTVLTVLSV